MANIPPLTDPRLCLCFLPPLLSFTFPLALLRLPPLPQSHFPFPSTVSLDFVALERAECLVGNKHSRHFQPEGVCRRADRQPRARQLPPCWAVEVPILLSSLYFPSGLQVLSRSFQWSFQQC